MAHLKSDMSQFLRADPFSLRKIPQWDEATLKISRNFRGFSQAFATAQLRLQSGQKCGK
jgi:hypothetical protein